jgi:hypothetical protein
MSTLGLFFDPVLQQGVEFEQSEQRRSSPAHPHARELLDYWYEREKVLVMGRDLPSRRVTAMLPNLAVFEYRQNRRDFHVRLAGHELARRYGCDIGRRHLAEFLSGDEHDRLRSVLVDATDSGIPQIRHVKIKAARRASMHFEALFLRIAAADRKTPLVLGGYFFFGPAAHEARP